MIFTLVSCIALLLVVTAFFYYQLLKQKSINQSQNSDLIRINRNQAFQSNLWDDMEDVVIIHSLSGNIVRTNDAFTRRLGYPENTWKDQLFINLIHPDHLHEYEIYMENIQDINGAKGILYLKNADDSECVFEYTGKIYRYENIKYVQWIGEDIGKRVSLQRNLVSAEKKFDILFDLLPDSGLILDINGIILHCSRNIKHLIGYDPTDIIGQSFSKFIKPTTQDDTENKFEISKLEIQSTELNFLHKEGHYINALIHSQPFYDDKDNFIGIFVICYDRSAQKKLEREKSLLEDQFQQRQKIEILGMLAGGISHDFNNILSAVLGFSDIALEELEKNHPARESVEEIISAGQYGRDLVRQILLFGRKSETDFKPLKIKPILKQSMKLVRALLPSNVELVARITLTDETIITDPVQIHQILFNLFTNAIYAMKQNMHGILRISADSVAINDEKSQYQLKSGEYIKIQIEDNGCGISSDQVNKIYDPFFTTKTAGEGTGMGLSIVKRIVDQHGGIISLKSDVGDGASFTILLPVTGTTHKLFSELQYQKVSGKGSILVVDKNDSVLRMIDKVLSRLGYHVTTIEDPDEAISEFENNPTSYDLVITEHLIPRDYLGYISQLIHQIRKDLPIIILSGYIDESTLDFQKEDYIFAYLDKPVNPALLSKTIANALDTSRIKTFSD